MSDPAVSVVVATYNHGRWLGDAIASVRAQTLADWELLVADDGSTDDTAAVVASSGDSRVRYLPGVRAERAAARNRGIAAARGELVAFLDADDLWPPRKLELQIERGDRPRPNRHGTAHGAKALRRDQDFVPPRGHSFEPVLPRCARQRGEDRGRGLGIAEDAEVVPADQGMPAEQDARPLVLFGSGARPRGAPRVPARAFR